MEEADRRLADNIFELATHIDLQTEQIGHQGNFIGFLESQIVDNHTMMKEKKIGLLKKVLEEAEKQNKDDMSVMRQMILDLETKNEKSKTSGCFSGIMNWCR